MTTPGKISIMKVFISKSSDLYDLYVKRMINYAFDNNELYFTNDTIVYLGEYPTLSEMIDFVNNFVDFNQQKDDSILAHYFILEPVNKAKLITYINKVEFVFGYKKIYNLIVKAIQERVKNENFYMTSVQSIDFKSKSQIIKNIEAKIGKKNVVLYKSNKKLTDSLTK